MLQNCLMQGDTHWSLSYEVKTNIKGVLAGRRPSKKTVANFYFFSFWFSPYFDFPDRLRTVVVPLCGWKLVGNQKNGPEKKGKKRKKKYSGVHLRVSTLKQPSFQKIKNLESLFSLSLRIYPGSVFILFFCCCCYFFAYFIILLTNAVKSLSVTSTNIFEIQE